MATFTKTNFRRLKRIVNNLLQGSIKTHLPLLFLFFIVTGKTFAQPTFPVCEKNGEQFLPKCTSNDLEVLGASLTGTQCGCTQGQQITATLNLTIINKTQSDRTSIAFFANVVATNPDGSPGGVQYKSGCVPTPPTPGTPGIPGGQTKTFGVVQITYTCGQTLKLENLYLAWTDASGGDNRQCPLDFCEIAPKCGTPETSIDIIPLLSASASAPIIPCNATTTTLTVTATGGKAPYQYSLNGQPFQSGNTFTVGVGTYTVTVKDAATPTNCTVATNQVTVTSTPVLTTPSGSPSHPGCGQTNGSISITNYDATVTYTLLQNGNPTGITQSGGVFSNVPPGTYTIRASKQGSCDATSGNITVNNPPSDLAVQFSVTQPTCTTAGSISITGYDPNITYTLLSSGNPIVVPFSGGLFSSLLQGIYQIRASRDGYCSATSGNIEIFATPVCTTNEGCTPGYWKNHPGAWTTTIYSPTQSLISVFPNSYTPTGATLMDALSFKGGSGLQGAAMNLLRAAVAALLNAASSDVDYPRTAAQVIAAVNAALASADRNTMLSLAQELDADNNLGCPLNNSYETRTLITSRPVTQDAKVTKLNVLASPNPYSDKVRFTIQSPKAGKATLEVFNLMGQKVGVPFDGVLSANETRNVEYTVPVNHTSGLIYKLSMNGEQLTGKMISTRK